MIRLGHVAVPAARPAELGRFYADVLGLEHVRAVANELGGEMVELAGGSGEDHELVLLERPEARHVAFRAGTLDELRRVHAACVAAGVPVLFPRDAGHAISFVIRDPEGNAVELYWATGRPRAEQPVPFAF
jgi:catechol 2,3-dioxygenase-like lactoylglutathione lyase family enzyme